MFLGRIADFLSYLSVFWLYDCKYVYCLSVCIFLCSTLCLFVKWFAPTDSLSLFSHMSICQHFYHALQGQRTNLFVQEKDGKCRTFFETACTTRYVEKKTGNSTQILRFGGQIYPPPPNSSIT